MATAGQHAQPAAGAETPKVTPIANGAKPPTQIQVFRAELDKIRKQIEAALPAHIDAARFFRVVVTTFQETPALLECTKASVFGRLMQCAALGLEPDGLLGHAHLTPRWNEKKKRKECKLIVGYKGLAKLARQSGEVTDIVARVVYEKDTFDYEYGLHEKLVHRPYMPQDIDDVNDHGGKAAWVYCIFRLTGGGNHFEVMTSQQVEKIRQNSDYPDGSAWVDHWDEMAKKTVLRRTAKLSPASVDDKVSKAVALDERADADLPQDVGSGLLIEDGDRAVGELAPEPQADPSSLKQRKDIITAAGAAKVALSMVASWFERQSIEDLTRTEADQALARLAKLSADAKAKSGEAIR